MLNCTGSECILHAHHYYEHLHQLQQMQHHLQDHREHHAMSGEPGELEDNTYLNETGGDSDVAGLSHLDAPSEGVYIVCGVLIAMILVAAIIILLAVFISKLRKRDENNRHSTVHHRHPQDRVILQSAQTIQQQNNINNNHHLHHLNNNNNINNNGTTTPPTVNGGTTTIQTVSSTIIFPPSPLPAEPANQPRQFIWQIPATHPCALYSNDKDTLVHPLPTEQPGFCHGFRKNLQGRWKRLVKRKPENEAYAIPPELRDQLKNIYVY